MTFVSNLKGIMRDRDISQSELGRRLGITSQAVNQWLKKSDGTMPKGTRIEDVAKALDIPTQALFANGPEAVRSSPSLRRPAPSKRSPYDGAIPDTKRTSKFGNKAVDIRFEAIWGRLGLAGKKTLLTVAIELERGRKSGAA